MRTLCHDWLCMYGLCLQSQRNNLVSSSALCLEQVNLLWVFCTGSLNFTKGGDAINSRFQCLTSLILLLSSWNFVSSRLSQLHLLLLLGLTRASLHTPNRQQWQQSCLWSPCLQSFSEHGWLITAVVSCNRTENPPILETSLLHQEASGWGFPKLSLCLGEVKM